MERAMLRTEGARAETGRYAVRSRILGVFLALTTATGVAAAVGPIVSTASAYSCSTYYDVMIEREYVDGWGKFNPCGGRSVNLINGTGPYGAIACVGAYDIASGTWAGTSVCAYGDVDHWYNGTNRLGWGGVPYGHVAELNTTEVFW